MPDTPDNKATAPATPAPAAGTPNPAPANPAPPAPAAKTTPAPAPAVVPPVDVAAVLADPVYAAEFARIQLGIKEATAKHADKTKEKTYIDPEAFKELEEAYKDLYPTYYAKRQFYRNERTLSGSAAAEKDVTQKVDILTAQLNKDLEARVAEKVPAATAKKAIAATKGEVNSSGFLGWLMGLFQTKAGGPNWGAVGGSVLGGGLIAFLLGKSAPNLHPLLKMVNVAALGGAGAMVGGKLFEAWQTHVTPTNPVKPPVTTSSISPSKETPVQQVAIEVPAGLPNVAKKNGQSAGLST